MQPILVKGAEYGLQETLCGLGEDVRADVVNLAAGDAAAAARSDAAGDNDTAGSKSISKCFKCAAENHPSGVLASGQFEGQLWA